MDEDMSDDDSAWDVGVFDAHCHPTDIMASIKDISSMRARTLTVMASRSQDQHLVADSAKSYFITGEYDLDNSSSTYVVPAFGWHPWFSYQIYDDRGPDPIPSTHEHYLTVLFPSPKDDDSFLQSLVQPIPLSAYLRETEERLRQFPLALVGEVGLDRAFRLPFGDFKSAGDLATKTDGCDEDYTPGSREGRPLSPYRVSLEHQKMLLRAQFELAGKLQRPVSVHSVQTHGAVFDLLQTMWKGYERPSKRERKRRRSAPSGHNHERNNIMDLDNPPLPFPQRICMHSYSGPPDALKQFLAPNVPADVYFSFSMLINFSSVQVTKAINVIKALPDDRILIESDFHCAGEKMDELLKEIAIKVCEIKGWKLSDGFIKLRDNYKRFVFG
jgi:Tat protein secretion system quality control protein TatD with DNase activity